MSYVIGSNIFGKNIDVKFIELDAKENVLKTLALTNDFVKL